MSTRDILTDLGEVAIRRFGYGGFSYADLARDAGIKKASIHHHFPAKADLGLAVLERYAQRLKETLEAISATSATANEAQARAIGVYREALGDGSKMCLCAALAGDGGRLSDPMQARLAAANAMVARWLAKTFEQGASDGSITAVGDAAGRPIATLARLQGAQMIARAARDVTLFDEAMQDLTA